MPFSIIVATDLHGGIGKDNKLPWHIKQDLQYFKNKTLDKIIIMGSNTYFSLPDRPLKYRKNVVLTSNKYRKEIIEKEGTIVYDNINDILTKFKDNDCFIIGGSSIYKQFMNHCDTMYITRVAGKYDCDTFFPEYDKYEWFKKSAGNWMERDYYVYKFQTFEKIKDQNDIKYIYNVYVNNSKDELLYDISAFKGSVEYDKTISYIREQKIKKLIKQ